MTCSMRNPGALGSFFLQNLFSQGKKCLPRLEFSRLFKTTLKDSHEGLAKFELDLAIEKYQFWGLVLEASVINDFGVSVESSSARPRY